MGLFCNVPFRVRQTLRAGGIVAYPTEGVYGLGCDPDNAEALRRLIHIKRRDSAKGLVLIGANAAQLLPFIHTDDAATRQRLIDTLNTPHGERATTLVVDASNRCHPLLTGGRNTIAVRIAGLQTAANLCRAFDGALVSTSANTSGQTSINRRMLLRAQFADRVDALLPRDNGAQTGVSRIIRFPSGEVLRD